VQKRISNFQEKRPWKSAQRYELEITNARSTQANVEVELRIYGNTELVKASRRLVTKKRPPFVESQRPGQRPNRADLHVRPIAAKDAAGDETD
jgi:hypothetical protein